ncbi:MAG TPA: HAMP domain-containing protein, partial [Gaiellaceae bacterium]|nr:HAMP domain-containing protein [Gaiellaceae bacterium]
MSFRARIALASAGAVAIAVVVASAVVYVAVRSELRGQVDDALRERAAAVAETRAHPGEIFPRIPAPVLGGAAGYFQVVRRDGRVFRPAGDDLALPVSTRTLGVAGQTESPYFEDARVAGTHVRILTVDLSPDGYAIQIARPLTEVDDLLGRVRTILLLVSLGGVGLAAALGLAVSRTALAPVRRLTEATEEVTATRDLSRRMEDGARDELGRLAASFNTMLATLEDSARSQRRLVADASHELRTPLTSLRTNIEVLARAEDMAPAERERLLADV